MARFRERFHMPRHAGRDALYFTGNSLGLQPVAAAEYIEGELEDWRQFGVEGHFEGRRPWVDYHSFATEDLAYIVGARPVEVVAMNALTVNLHLLLISFYRPEGRRTKLMIEHGAFPSDRYAALSQLRLHGLDPETHLIELHPRNGESTLRAEDIEARIAEEGDELACVMLCGVQYYTGQWMPMERITQLPMPWGPRVDSTSPMPWATSRFNCTIGTSTSPAGVATNASAAARAAPRAPLCTSVAQRPDLPRLEGWWGHSASRRFLMEPDFDLMPGAEGWRASSPVLNMAALLASLKEFRAAGMDQLREKSLALTAFLERGLHSVAEATGTQLEILTPTSPEDRGCQLSVVAHGQGKALFDHLTANGVVVDWREPAVIRMAPVPLYNRFADVADFLVILADGLRETE